MILGFGTGFGDAFFFFSSFAVDKVLFTFDGFMEKPTILLSSDNSTMHS